MFLIVGLGNPGSKYTNTPHNLGFLAVDHLAKLYAFSAWRTDKTAQVLWCEKKIGREKIILAKPQTFMNNSGLAVQKLTSFYKVPNNKLIIIHDEHDLIFGRHKISLDSSAAGHKGVQSIIDQLGRQDFLRLRLGCRLANQPALQTVLARFNSEQKKVLSVILNDTTQALLKIIGNDLAGAMNDFNQ